MAPRLTLKVKGHRSRSPGRKMWYLHFTWWIQCKPILLDITQPTLTLRNTPGHCATLLEIAQLCEDKVPLSWPRPRWSVPSVPYGVHCKLQSMEYMLHMAHWMHRRGRKNFCLQKLRMPLAGLVYLYLGNGQFVLSVALSAFKTDLLTHSGMIS